MQTLRILFLLLLSLLSLSVPAQSETVLLPKHTTSWGMAPDFPQEGMTLVNGAAISATNTKLGAAALNLDGVNDYAEMPFVQEFDRVDNFSVSLWVRFNSGGIDGKGVSYVASKMNLASATNKGWGIGVIGTAVACSGTGANEAFFWMGVTVCGPPSVPLADTNWYLLTVVVSNGTATVYVNDTAGTPAAVSAANANYKISFGRRTDNASFYTAGQIDDARYYPFALTSSEVSAIYNAGSGVECDGDRHHCWNFNTLHKTNYHSYYHESATFNNTRVRPTAIIESFQDWYQNVDRGNIVSLAPAMTTEGFWYTGSNGAQTKWYDWSSKERFLLGTFSGTYSNNLSIPHGYAYNFTASNWKTATGEDAAVSATNAFTFYVKFKTPATLTVIKPIVEGYNGTNDSAALYTDAAGKLNFRIRGAGGMDTITSASALSAGTWYVAVARFDGTNLRLKYNATTVTPVTTVNTAFTSFADFWVGVASTVTTNKWDSLIGEVGAYSVAVTDAEVDWLINSGNGRIKPMIYPSSGTYTTPNIQLPNTGSVTKVNWVSDEPTGTLIEYTTSQKDIRIKCASSEGGLAGASWTTVTNGGAPAAGCGGTTAWVKLEFTLKSSSRFRSPQLYGAMIETDAATPCPVGYKTKQLYIDNNEEYKLNGLVSFRLDTLNVLPSLSNWNDIRIYRKFGGSATELDRAISGDEVHFKTQAAITAYGQDASYYLCYGYSGAGAPPSTLSNIYSDSSDFTDLTGWTKIETSGTGTITNGELVVNLNAALPVASIINPSFENALGAEWTCQNCGTMTRQTSPTPTHGSYILNWTGNGSPGLVQQAITVTANTEYTIKADIRDTSDIYSTTLYVSTSSYNTGAAVCSASDTLDAVWETLSCVVPSSNAATTLYVIMGTSGASSYADNLQIVQPEAKVRIARTTANSGPEKREMFDVCTPASATGLAIRMGFVYSTSGEWAERTMFTVGGATVDMMAQVDAVTSGTSRTKTPVNNIASSTCYTFDFQVAKNNQLMKVYNRTTKALVWSGVADISNQSWPEETSLHPAVEIMNTAASALNGTTIDNWRAGLHALPGFQVEPFEWTKCSVDGDVFPSEDIQIDASGNEIYFKRWARLFKSTDGCRSTPTELFDFGENFGEQAISAIYKTVAGSLLVTTNIDGIIYRCPAGSDCTLLASWTKVYQNNLTGGYRRAMTVGWQMDEDSSNRIFFTQYGCTKGQHLDCDNNGNKMFALRSSNDGATWEVIYRLHMKNRHFHSIRVDKGTTPNKVYISSHADDSLIGGRVLVAASDCVVQGSYGCRFGDAVVTPSAGTVQADGGGCTNSTTQVKTDITGYADGYWNGGIIRFESGTNIYEDKDILSYTASSGCVTIDTTAPRTALPNTPSAGDTVNLAKALDKQDILSVTTTNNLLSADRSFISLLDDGTDNKIVRYNNAQAPFVDLYSFGIGSNFDKDGGTTVIHNTNTSRTVALWQNVTPNNAGCHTRFDSSTYHAKFSWIGFSDSNGDSFDTLYIQPLMLCNGRWLNSSPPNRVVGVSMPVYLAASGKYAPPVILKVNYTKPMKMIPIHRIIVGD